MLCHPSRLNAREHAGHEGEDEASARIRITILKRTVCSAVGDQIRGLLQQLHFERPLNFSASE
jgi:hypothetical protein